jgi:hypothetical protein
MSEFQTTGLQLLIITEHYQSQSLQVCQFFAGLVLARLPCLFKTVFCKHYFCKNALQTLFYTRSS